MMKTGIKIKQLSHSSKGHEEVDTFSHNPHTGSAYTTVSNGWTFTHTLITVQIKINISTEKIHANGTTTN